MWRDAAAHANGEHNSISDLEHRHQPADVTARRTAPIGRSPQRRRRSIPAPGGLRSISVAIFEPGGMRQVQLAAPVELKPLVQRGHPLWVQLQGSGDPIRLQEALVQLRIPAQHHSALMASSPHTLVESDGQVVLLLLHRLKNGAMDGHLHSEQVNLLLMPNLLLSIEEQPKPQAFPGLIRWLASLDPPPGASDLDDVLHFLVDELLDDNQPLLDAIAAKLDHIEEDALDNLDPDLLGRVYDVRTNLRRIKQQIWPLKHQIAVLLRQNQRLISDDAYEGFRDMGQHVDQIYEQTEMLRHQCDAVTATFMANTNNRMNQVMKTLAVISSIFAPISFIASVYGMNFQTMPELAWRYGYPLCLGVMAAVVMVQSTWLWRRGWFADWTGTRQRQRRRLSRQRGLDTPAPGSGRG